MKKTTTIIIMLLFIVILSSCATIMNGTNQQINITSDPIEAKVFIDNEELGKTPYLAELSRKDNHLVKIELEGYETKVIKLNRKMSNWFIGNCLIGGIIGMGIDAITGGMYILKPEQIDESLMKDRNLAQNDSDKIYIKIVMNPDPSWKKIDQLEKI